MRILADESVEGEVVARLRSQGHDVAYILGASAGIRDDEVLARANAEDRVLLTEDKDFGDLAFLYGNRSSGLVLLRAHGADESLVLVGEACLFDLVVAREFGKYEFLAR